MIIDAPLRFPELCRYAVLGETEFTRKAVRILTKLRPTALFKGYVVDPAEAKVDVLLVCDLAVPGAVELLREHRDAPDIAFMPVPVADIWSYWNFADYALDDLEVGATVKMSDEALLRVMVELERVHVEPGTGKILTKGDAFLYEKTDWVHPNIQHITNVLQHLADVDSRDAYSCLMTQPPAIHWANYVARVFDTIQYFELLDFDACQMVLNGGVFGGVELPFLAAKLPRGAEVHNFDPLGHAPLDPYVRPWIEAGLQRFVEHRVALAEGDGEAQLRIDGEGQVTRNVEAEVVQTFACRSIDSFVQEAGLGRVDLIKLDLEGCDFAALHGAVETMAFFRPQLALSIYHEIGDFWRIPLMVMQHCPDYDFHIRTYSSERWETVFYGVPKELRAARAAA